MKRLVTKALILGALMSLSACAKPEGEAKKAVRQYNEAVILAHRTGDTKKVAEVAGEKETSKLGVIIETKRNAGLVLEATLQTLEVTNVQKSNDDSMTVDTKERWSYYDRPLTPGKPSGNVINSEMTMRYDLQKEKGAWKVMKIGALGSKPLN